MRKQKIGQRAGHSAKMQDDRRAKKTSEWTLRASTRQKGGEMILRESVQPPGCKLHRREVFGQGR